MLGDAAGEESLTLKYGILCLNQKENDGGGLAPGDGQGGYLLGVVGVEEGLDDEMRHRLFHPDG